MSYTHQTAAGYNVTIGSATFEHNNSGGLLSLSSFTFASGTLTFQIGKFCIPRVVVVVHTGVRCTCRKRPQPPLWSGSITTLTGSVRSSATTVEVQCLCKYCNALQRIGNVNDIVLELYTPRVL